MLEYLKSHVALLVIMILIVIMIAALVVWLLVLLYKKKKQPQELSSEPAEAPPKVSAEERSPKETSSAEERSPKETSSAEETENTEEPIQTKQEEPEMKKQEPEKKSQPQKAQKAAPAKAASPKAAAKAAPAKSNAAGKWVLYEEDRGGFGFKLLASNGEVMLRSSSPYASLQSAKAGIKTYQDNIAADRLEVVETKKGNFFVQINNASKRMLATSADYPTRSSCESALSSIKRWAQSTAIVTENDEEK